jgi:serine kinase of HPr protein (carbohydrate metabolism regulator)
VTAAFLHSATCVALNGRALLIEGPSGSGKSTLALQLIDRGGVLVGDDGVTLKRRGCQLIANPPPNIVGLLEVRNLGLLKFPVASAVPVALVLRIDADAPRFIEAAERVEMGGVDLPLVRVWPGGSELALKAELALERYGVG